MPAAPTTNRDAISRARQLIAHADPEADSRGNNHQTGTVAGTTTTPVRRPNGQLYHPRQLGTLCDIDLLRDARTRSIYPLLAGPPGGGKTALVEAAYGEELITVNCDADTEVADLIGTYVPTTTPGQYRWVDGPALRAAKEGTVLFLDDITVAPAGVLAKLYPLLDGRKTITVTQHQNEQVTAADGFFVVGAHNPGLLGTHLSEALASRFLLHITIRTDLTLARHLGVNRALLRVAERLQTSREAGALTWAPEMRELLAFQQLEEAYGTELAAANLIGQAPEPDRDLVTDEVQAAFPGATPLQLHQRAADETRR